MVMDKRRPKTVKVTVYSARNLKSKKGNGEPVAWVIFGFGKEKSCTAQIKDRNPTWNEESTFTATDPKIPLKINVKDKDDPLGQILIPLSDIPSEEHFLKWVTLGPHKKNISPSGEICIDCWIVEFYEDDEILKEKKTLFNKTLNRLTGRSPEPFRKFSPDSDRKFSVSQGNSSLKGSVSIEDISSNYKYKNLRIKDSLVAPPSYRNGQNHNIRKTTSSLDVSNINNEDKRFSMDLSNINQLPVIKEQAYPPKIASIVPTSGPTTGGTLIQVNGKYLGNSKDDITRLSVGGCNCLASVEYYSSNKIMCTTSQSQGIGPITISTRSGGMSSSKMMFEFIDCVKETDENDKVDHSKVPPHERERDSGRSSGLSNISEKDELIGQLRNEIDELKYDNRELREYVDRLVLYLMNKYPDALESSKMYHR